MHGHRCRSRLCWVTAVYQSMISLVCRWGDIIRLDTKVDEDLSVYVGNIKKFTALPGASGDNYAVRVTSVIREEQ